MSGDNNFIEKLKFVGITNSEGKEEHFLPFKNGDEILFGGEKEMQKLIEFYLKNKSKNENKWKEIWKKLKKVLNIQLKNKGKLIEDNWKDEYFKISSKINSKRFKINCILGNNGDGKSRLFEGILESEIYKQANDDLGTKLTGFSNKNIVINDGKNKFSLGRNIILDDFFILSKKREENCNSELLWKGFNFFYLNLFKFLSKNRKVKLFKECGSYTLISRFSYEYQYKKDNNFDKLNRIDSNPIKYYNSLYIILEIMKFLNNDIYDKGFKKNFIDNKIELNTLIYDTDFIFLFIEDILFSGESIDVSDFPKNEEKKYIKLICTCLNLYIKKCGKGKTKEFNLRIKVLKKELKELNEKGYTFTNLITIFSKNEEELEDYIFDGLYSGNKKFPDIKFTFNFNSFSNIESGKLFNVIFDTDILYTDINEIYFTKMSSGEKLLHARFSNIYMKIIEEVKNGKINFTILIDEPDLHLHLDWQKKYIQKLIDVFSTLDPNIKLHFIIATHSPFIISDLPSESIILLDKKEGEKYTEIKNYDGKKQDENEKLKTKTFGANYIDIIRDGFFFQKNEALMGGFAESVIKDISKLEKEKVFNNIDYNDEIKNFIGNDFLKNNLIYFNTEKGKK